MLDREEDAALAEIEAALRRDDPAFVALIESLDQERDTRRELEPSPTVVHGVPEIEVDLDRWPGQSDDELGIDSSSVPMWLFVEDTEPRRRRWVVALQSVLSVLAAFVVTVLTAVVAGPNVGGLVGVVTITAASLIAYQRLRGCPGRRHA